MIIITLFHLKKVLRTEIIFFPVLTTYWHSDIYGLHD
jgi:hypothetical protein